MDGKQATTHWIASEEFRRCYPRVRLTPERMIVDAGDVVSSGGATTFLSLVVYLSERYGNHDRAVLASKVMLVDGERGSQLPYVAFAPSRDHLDEMVHEVQSLMGQHLGENISVSDLAARASISTRTLSRRFVKATGETPRRHLQGIRIRTARRLLETTTDPVDQITARVGYGDSAAFRRAFIRNTGLGPRQCRRKYGPRRGDT